MIAGIHHLVLFCADTERSREFYASLGFEYLRGYDGMHWFKVGTAELMLHPAEAGEKRGAPVIHFATPDVNELFEVAVAAGTEPFDHQQPGVRLTAPVTHPWGDVEFELLDPDGHVLAFTQAG